MSYTCNIKPGNLLKEENATFIVNASNTVLQLGSGVSAAFKQSCGIKIQMEMIKKYKSLNQKLQKGDVVATSAGDAKNFKYTLHTAVMNYNTGVRDKDKLPTINIIRKILQNIELYLQWYANNHNNEPMKLVLPLMGCGVGGLDTQKVLEIYKSFFSKEVSYQC